MVYAPLIENHQRRTGTSHQRLAVTRQTIGGKFVAALPEDTAIGYNATSSHAGVPNYSQRSHRMVSATGRRVNGPKFPSG